MGQAIIRVVDSMAIPVNEHRAFIRFLQGMMNRRQVGFLRYGVSKARQKYMTRMKMEVEAYEKTGNMEQLYNIAAYAFLESFTPENKNFHHDASADSVTRKKMGGNIA